MTKDGTEARNLKYQDVCPVAVEAAENNEIRVAYNIGSWTFHVNSDTNTMKEYPLWATLELSEKVPLVPKDWEILKIFFHNNNLEPKWINTNYVWGWYDQETDSWTGGVGQVSCRNLIYSHFNLSKFRLRVERQTWQFLVMPVLFREWQLLTVRF